MATSGQQGQIVGKYRDSLIYRSFVCKVYVGKAFVLPGTRLVEHSDKLGLEFTEQICN
jgi:hypothetical protein